MTDTIHFDKWLYGEVSCGIVGYDYAHENLDRVTCKKCVRAVITKMRAKELIALIKFFISKESKLSKYAIRIAVYKLDKLTK